MTVIEAAPLQAWSGPECSRKLRFPRFRDNGTGRWKGCQPYAPAAFTPWKSSWYSFLLEAESTPKIMSPKNSNDTTWDRTSDLLIVAQHHNHCATAIPHMMVIPYSFINGRLQ